MQQTNTADMLEEVVEYVKFVQRQIQSLCYRGAKTNARYEVKQKPCFFLYILLIGYGMLVDFSDHLFQNKLNSIYI